jgi:hypothetical protein
MAEKWKFKKDKHYTDRAGNRYCCLWVKDNGNAWVIDLETEYVSCRHPSGTDWEYYTTAEHPTDIIGEWREPRTWEVYVVGDIDCALAAMAPCGRNILARVTITEGEGL